MVSNEKKFFTDKLILAVESGKSYYQQIIERNNYKYFSIKLDCSWLEDPENFQDGNGKYPLCQKIKDNFFVEFDTYNEAKKKIK